MSFIKKLWGPFLDSIEGKLSWKEILMAVLLTAIYFVFGGELATMVKQLLASVDLNNFDPQQVTDALILLVVAILHKWQQGKVKVD